MKKKSSTESKKEVYHFMPRHREEMETAHEIIKLLAASKANVRLAKSAFDKTDKNSPIPAKNNSVLKSPGLLAKDANVVYAGSLKRKDTAKLFGLVSLDASKKSEMITIWNFKTA